MYSVQTIKDHLEKQFSLPEEQIEAMLPSFIDTLSSHMENLQKALGKGDMILLARAGHTIKGAFLNLGLEECARIALTIETKCKEGDDSENFGHLVQQLKTQMSSVLAHTD